mgnify:CR=1 FL=1
MYPNNRPRWPIYLSGFALAFALGFGAAWLLKPNGPARSTSSESSRHPSLPVVIQRVEYPPLNPSKSAGCPAEAEYQELERASSPTPETVQALARQWTAHLPGGPLHVAQLVAVADSLMHKWSYRNDPTHLDALKPASRAIIEGFQGDCEDFAASGAALVQALGGRVRVIKAWRGDEGHSWLEVNLGKLPLDYRQVGSHSVYEQEGQCWLRVDWSCRQGTCFEPDRGLVFDLSEKSCHTLP